MFGPLLKGLSLHQLGAACHRSGIWRQHQCCDWQSLSGLRKSDQLSDEKQMVSENIMARQFLALLTRRKLVYHPYLFKK